MQDEGAPETAGCTASPWIGFLAAVQFLTIAPAIIQRPFSAKEIGAAVGYFPLVGAILGALLAVSDTLLAGIFPSPARNALLLALWVLLTGALHMDGLLDSLDGLLGGGTPEKRLAIMRDERVGAYALIGGSLLLLLKFSALFSLPDRWAALVITPTLGRWGMSLAIVAFPYARPEGLGRTMKDQASWLHASIATLAALAVVWLIGQLTGLALMVVAALGVILGARYALSRIPGLTGDIYGALNEIIEILILLGWEILH